MASLRCLLTAHSPDQAWSGLFLRGASNAARGPASDWSLKRPVHRAPDGGKAWRQTLLEILLEPKPVIPHISRVHRMPPTNLVDRHTQSPRDRRPFGRACQPTAIDD